MHRRALQVAGVIGLFISGVTCMVASEPEEGRDRSNGTGATGEASGGYDGPTKSGVHSANTTSAPVPGAGGSGGAGGDINQGGQGGAGGNKVEIPAECEVKVKETFTATLAVEDTNAYASPAYVREILKSDSNDAPSLNLIKGHEFFNYYALPYAGPGNLPVGITAGMREVGPGEYRFLVGVTAPQATARPRVNVAIVVDTSISMTVAAMVRARAIARAIGKSLNEGDVVSLVTWNPDVLPKPAGLVVSGPDDPAFTSAVDALYADGGSDLQAGLVRGYELVKKSFDPVALNRVVFISDGRVTLGTWEEDIVRSHAQSSDGKNVLLVGAATGPGPGYDDSMMTKMTAAGLGSYVYVDSELEAARLFHERFDEVMGEPYYDNVTLSLAVPGILSMPEVDEDSGSYTLDPATVVGRPLAPGDSVTFNHVMQACHPLVINASYDHTVNIAIAWRKRGTGETQTTETKLTIGELMSSTHPGIEKANAIALYVDALQSVGGGGDPKVLGLAWTAIDEINSKSFKPDASKPGDPELEEILGLLKRHPKYSVPAQQ